MKNRLVRFIIPLVIGALIGFAVITGTGSRENNRGQTKKKPVKTEKVTEEILTPFQVPGPDSLCSHAIPDPETDSQRIVYIESTGEKCLTPRQACGIESAAWSNPQMKIQVYINNRTLGPPIREQSIFLPGKERTCAANKMLERFPNVEIIHQDLTDLLKGTPFWPIYDSGELEQSQWPIVHLSDMVRLVLLKKSGGIYLDFDNIVFRPLHCLRNTFSYLEEVPHIENGIMIIDAGHPFLNFLLQYLSRTYNGTLRMCLGPPAFGTAFQMFCKTQNLANGTYRCANRSSLHLIHPDAFFPVRHTQHPYFYSKSIDGLNTEPMKRAYLTHVYLSGWGSQVQSGSLYARLAKHYCPLSWKVAFSENLIYGF